MDKNLEANKNNSEGQSFEDEVKKHPELSSWAFLVEDMRSELRGVWMFFFVYQTIREVVTIFFIIYFIGQPLL